MSEKSIENITTSENNFAPNFIDTHQLPDEKLNGHCSINKLLDSEKAINHIFLSH